MSLPAAGFSRYLPADPEAVAWGLRTIDVGFARVPPGSRYPPVPHPEGYSFTWTRGRVLQEFQVVYLSGGRGEFESQRAGRRRVGAGDVLLLFPGEWHRYRPAAAAGWDESWIGFDGAHAQQIMTHFFDAAAPVVHVGHSEELLGLMRSVGDRARIGQPGQAQLMAARTLEVLALVRSLALRARGAVHPAESRMQKARLLLLERAREPIDLTRLAREVGMSYSRFRHAFQKSAGLSPRQYQLQIRINHAKTLLADTDLSIADVAEQVGFSSIFYFSRLFRRKAGTTPRAFRTRQRAGRNT